MVKSQQLTIPKAIRKAKKAIKQGDISTAQQLYNVVLQQQPNHPVAKKGLRKLGKKLPRNQYVQTQIINPSQDQINALTNLYYSGQIAKAEQVCKELLQTFPQSLVVINVLGAALKRQGKLHEAVQSFEKAIQLKPDYAEAYNNRGVILKDLGQLEEAVKCYDKAIQLKPDYAEAYSNRGVTLKGLGQLEEAVKCYDKAIQLKPDYAEAYNNRGVTLKDLGQLKEAVKCYDKAIQLKPDFTEAYSSRGVILKDLGQLEEAVKCYDKAIQLKPDFSEAYSNRGVTLKDLGQLEEAVKCYDKAIQLKPGFAEAYSNRGNALKDLGQLEEAVKCYDKAIQLKPDYAEAYGNRGNALQELGQSDVAITNYQKALSIDSRNVLLWTGFASVLQTVRFTSYSDDLSYYLLQVLEQPTVRPKDISKTVISTLRYHPIVLHILGLSKIARFGEDIDHIAGQLSTVPLLLRLMELSQILDLDVEKMLTKMRKAMLYKAINGGFETRGLPFYAALAIHCFINEYIFSESEKEKQIVELLQEKIRISLEKKESVPPTWIAVLGAYRPLYSFSWIDGLMEFDWSVDIKKVIAGQIDNVREEHALRPKIKRLTSIEDRVSKLVRSQYEKNPYPRWINTGLVDKPMAIKQVLQSIRLHLDYDAQQFSNKPDILVAGCGTGQHALVTASRFLNCHVLAVDLSLSSLSYAIRKTKELGITNIEYMQGDILELDQIEKKFDVIEAIGVLHHMNDPLAGWKVMADKLCAGGLMKIGLYSDIARQHIVEAIRQIVKKKYTTSPDDIRKCRQEIIDMELNSDSGILNIINSNDFYSLSECRDLLFHVQEHRFTLPQINMILNDLCLKFLGFEMKQSSVINRFKEIYTEKNALTCLTKWHEFELKNPDVFLGMYQFWVQKV